MASTRVLLLLGAGPNIGLHTTRLFKAQGFKIALAARSPSEELSKEADVTVKADFFEPSSVSEVFKEVISKLGHPSVVLYNGKTLRVSSTNNISLFIDIHTNAPPSRRSFPLSR